MRRRGYRWPALAATVLGLSVAAPAAALGGEATMWACHGPAGEPLAQVPIVGSSAGDGIRSAFGTGCTGTAAVFADGGLKASFLRPDPMGGSIASYRVDVPAGTTLHGVSVTRATEGFGGLPFPGAADRYRLFTTAGTLETTRVDDLSSTALSGTFTSSSAAGDFVFLGIDCDLPGSIRCSDPGSPTPAIAFSAIAMAVTDADPPRAALGGVQSPSAGTMHLAAAATDVGLGLARATVTLDGNAFSTTALGGTTCADLSPGGAIDLPLGAACPSSVASLPINIDTTTLAEGPHRLKVVFTDAAGNSGTAYDDDFVVQNRTVTGQSTATLTLGSGAGAGGGGTGGGGTGGGGTGGGGTGGGGAGTGGGTGGDDGNLICVKPILTIKLDQRPIRRIKSVPLLKYDTRYRYRGKLTCISNGKRHTAPVNTHIHIRVKVHSKYREVSGTGTRGQGLITAILSYKTSRTLEFLFTSNTGESSRVRIPIKVAPKPKVPKHKG